MAQYLNSARARIAPLLQKAQSTVEPTYRLAEKHAVSQYDSLMKKNSQYVVKDPEAAEKLLKQYMFTTLSRSASPPICWTCMSPDPKGTEKVPAGADAYYWCCRIPTGISHCQQEYQQVSKKLAQGSHINMTEVSHCDIHLQENRPANAFALQVTQMPWPIGVCKKMMSCSGVQLLESMPAGSEGLPEGAQMAILSQPSAQILRVCMDFSTILSPGNLIHHIVPKCSNLVMIWR